MHDRALTKLDFELVVLMGPCRLHFSLSRRPEILISGRLPEKIFFSLSRPPRFVRDTSHGDSRFANCVPAHLKAGRDRNQCKRIARSVTDLQVRSEEHTTE